MSLTDARYQIKEELPALKTSKRILNSNAIRFKLRLLRTTSIRYEVIYKNLMRHMRRHYSKDFNTQTEYIRKKRNAGEQVYLDKLSAYVNSKIGAETLIKVGV